MSCFFQLKELNGFFLFLNSSFGWRWNRVHWHSKTDAEIDPKLLVSTTGTKIHVTYLITGTCFPGEVTTSIKEFPILKPINNFIPEDRFLLGQLLHRCEVFWEVNNAFQRPRFGVSFEDFVWFKPFKGFHVFFNDTDASFLGTWKCKMKLFELFFSKTSRFPRWKFPKPDSWRGRVHQGVRHLKKSQWPFRPGWVLWFFNKFCEWRREDAKVVVEAQLDSSSPFKDRCVWGFARMESF